MPVRLILASQSPRRKQLLSEAGYTFDIRVADIDETNPEGMAGESVPEHLAVEKAKVIAAQEPDTIVIAADTIVLLDNEILGKPKDLEDAVKMLQKLSGRVHRVVSGVCICYKDIISRFSVHTEVSFLPLSEAEIRYFVDTFKPLDKAGSYAIQEWIGLIGIEKINGDYYNVMGLPVSRVHRELQRFISTANKEA